MRRSRFLQTSDRNAAGRDGAVEFTALDGTTYRADFPTEGRIGVYTAGFVTWDQIAVPLRSQDAESAFATAEHIMGAKFDGEYSVGKGTLHLGSFTTRDVDEDGNDVVLGKSAVGLWESEGIALWGETDLRSEEWMAEFFASMRPALENGTAIPKVADIVSANPESSHALVTVEDFAMVSVAPRRDDIPRFDGVKTEVGDLFQTMVDGEFSLVLETSDLVATFSFPERSNTELEDVVRTMKVLELVKS